MLKDLIKAIPTSRGMNSCRDQHSCRADPRVGQTLVSGRPSCGPLGPAFRSKPDPHVDARPRSPLLVDIVYVATGAGNMAIS